MRTGLVAGALLLMAGGADAKGVQTIRYATSPCFGACPVYTVTVSSDGRGVFEGQRFTAATGRHLFRVTPGQWRAFRDGLEAVHGRGTVELTGPPLCTAMATDLPGVVVTWSGAWRAHTLRANYGCRTDGQDWMFAHLRRAPDTLPIARFIGPPRGPKSGR